jgi:hypothetical protein
MPYNWCFPKGGEIERKVAWKDRFGLFDGDRLVGNAEAAWDRIDNPGRWMHDVTNLAIEWNRRWLPWSTKFLCALIVWPWVIYFVIKAIS